MSLLDVSVVIPAHNPHRGRLDEVLGALRRQTLPLSAWETLLIDNASSDFPQASSLEAVAPANLRLLREADLGLTAARLLAIRSARGTVIVMVDDDNVLAPDYLAEVARLFARNPRLGAAGGKSLPIFEAQPAQWLTEFLPLLALRDHGGEELVATTMRPPGAPAGQYPAFAPIGAGMALRREAAVVWADAMERDPLRRALDRRGSGLVSGGDNDIVMTLLEAGWAVGYYPTLSLRHLIPASRIEKGYLARLNRAIQRSWVQVLDIHGVNPWAPIRGWTVLLRKCRAYLRLRAWSSPERLVRWHGACGQFEGRALLRPRK